ncbi:hypothetical protein JXB12_09375 [candidate division KSB1 bacterium]|nr:hypothetical protein [candidate division KSB1 bacterium]
MKKITLLLNSKYRDRSLQKLRQLGVLHIKNIKAPEAEDIHLLEKQLDHLYAIDSLYGNLEGIEEESLPHDEIEAKIGEIISQRHEKDSLSRILDEKQEIHQWFDRWGNVSLESLKTLEDAGLYVRFYVADKKTFKNIESENTVHVSRIDQNSYYFAHFSRSKDERLELREEPIPQVEIADLDDEISEIKSKLSTIDEKIASYAKYRTSFNQFQDELKKRLILNRIKYGMGEEGEIIYLQGFCPEDQVESVKKEADIQGWGYVVEEPDDLKEVPTLTRNPRWVKIINPLFQFMGTLPGYDEMDVSSIFLAFFSVFYALIIGDAGYGLIFLIGTFLVSRKVKGSKDFINLMYLLSFTTIIWGMISGTWFGSQKIAELPFLKMFIIEPVYSFGANSQDVMMQISFIIGVVHLSMAHLMVAFKKMNSLTALGDIGWILILWSVFFVANDLILGKELPGITIPLLVAGILLVLIFANFQRNVLKGILSTIGNLPLDVISAFSDVVSYIRLFAVGLATVIVSSSFNSMAIGSGIDSILSGIMAAIILFLGHALNITLCAMSVLVHGVRLNLLEFSGHVGVQWTGTPYDPFKE